MAQSRPALTKETRQRLQQLADWVLETPRDPSWRAILSVVEEDPALLKARLPRSSDGGKSYLDWPLLNAGIARGIDAPVVRKLLELGAPVEARDSEGCTPLYRAASNNSGAVIKAWRGQEQVMDTLQTCQALLQAGARCDVRDNEAQDILQKTLHRLSPELLQELVARGAPLTRCNAHGTPLLSLVLKEAGSRPESPEEHEAPYERNLRFLIKACADVDPPVRLLRDLPLVAALNAHRPDLADLLVEQGARWHGSWDEGQTLMHAVNTVAGVDWLLRKDPSLLDVRDDRRRTPLLRLCDVLRGQLAGCVDAAATIPHMIRLGADLDASDDQGSLAMTPRQLLAQAREAGIKAFMQQWQTVEAARRALDEVAYPAGVRP